MRRCVFRSAASAEFAAAVAWYESKRVGLGEEFIEEIAGTLRRISGAPVKYPPVLRDARCAPVKRFPYRIYFRMRAGTIVVLAVFHVRRNPRKWQSRT
ncbi:MAG: type II toxin-antitoxin system RelE/ParE family toxin [Proteobacteria bacterium]|nr:type II toxin-antitoxin system RelE/ParE family toxin [Pseudomonadota bacterium]